MITRFLILAWLTLVGAFAAETPVSGGVLKMALHGEPKTFDPFLVEDEISANIRYMTGGALIRLNRQTQKMEPELASSWVISEGGRKITFRIRDGVRFSDGTPLTAEDVAKCLRRLVDTKHPTPSGDSFGAAEAGAAVEVLASNQVALKFAKPRAGMELLFDMVVISRDKASLGPFLLKEYKPGQYVHLERNPNYWKMGANGKRLPYLDGVRLEIVTNREMELLRFRRGELHLLSQVESEMFERLQADKTVAALDGGPSLESEFLWFNQNPAAPLSANRKSWFQLAAFRQAVSEAINRDDICRLVYHGKAQPSIGPVSPANQFWFNRELKAPVYSPLSALKKLEALGFASKGGVLMDKTGKAVEFSVITNTGSKTREKIATLLQQDLAKIGIRLNIVTLDFPSLIERITKTYDYDACLLGLVNIQLDPNSEMNVWLSSAANHQWFPNQKTPATAWEAELDKNMLAQASAMDPAKRKLYYDQVQRIIVEQKPFIYLINKNTLAAGGASLRNLRISNLYPQTFWNIDEIYMSRQGAGK